MVQLARRGRRRSEEERGDKNELKIRMEKEGRREEEKEEKKAMKVSAKKQRTDEAI